MGLASSSTTLLDYEELIAQTSYPLETCYSSNSLATVRSSAFRRSHLHIRLEFRLQAVSLVEPRLANLIDLHRRLEFRLQAAKTNSHVRIIPSMSIIIYWVIPPDLFCL